MCSTEWSLSIVWIFFDPPETAQVLKGSELYLRFLVNTHLLKCNIKQLKAWSFRQWGRPSRRGVLKLLRTFLLKENCPVSRGPLYANLDVTSAVNGSNNWRVTWCLSSWSHFWFLDCPHTAHYRCAQNVLGQKSLLASRHHRMDCPWFK